MKKDITESVRKTLDPRYWQEIWRKMIPKNKCKCFPSSSRKKNGKWICNDCGFEVAGEPKVITEEQMNTHRDVDRYWKKHGKLPN